MTGEQEQSQRGVDDHADSSAGGGGWLVAGKRSFLVVWLGKSCGGEEGGSIQGFLAGALGESRSSESEGRAAAAASRGRAAARPARPGAFWQAGWVIGKGNLGDLEGRYRYRWACGRGMRVRLAAGISGLAP